MKDIRSRIVELIHNDYCTPQISRIAKRLKEPATTIHYNLRRLEEERVVLAYKAVFDYKKVDQGFTAFVLISIAADEYAKPEHIGHELAEHPEVESIDVCTGDWEMVLKVRTKDMDAYYDFVKRVLSRRGIAKITSLLSMHQLKTEFVAT